MKGRSEEKLRIGKISEKNPYLAIEETKPESSSKLTSDSKKGIVKKLLLRHDPETLKLKEGKQVYKPRCSGEARNYIKKVQRAVNCKTDQKAEKVQVSNQEGVDKIKKNKSLDQVASKDLSKVTLVKRVSDVFQKVSNEKSASEAKLSSEKPKIPENKSFLTTALDNYSSNLNFFGCNRNSQSGSFSSGQAAAKSLSFDSLKFPATRKLPKTLSVENSNNTYERPIGVFHVNKRSYTQAPEIIKKRNLTESMCSSCQTGEKRIVISQKIFAEKNKSYSRNSSNNSLLEYPNYRVALNEEQSHRNSSWESLLRSKSSNRTLDSVRKGNEQPWKDLLQEKKTVEICQCLHFHTEDGIKKICIQNSPKTRELGQKFFRVNYFPKGQDDEEEDMESQVEVVDAGTLTEIDPETLRDLESKSLKQKASWQTISEKHAVTRVKTGPRNSVNPTSKKQEKSKKKEETVFLPRQTGNRTHVSDGSTSSSRQETVYEKSPERRTKNKEGPRGKKPTEKAVIRKSTPVSRDRIDGQETLEELGLIENLEKLFLKLNSNENYMLKKKMLRACPENKRKVVGKKKATNEQLLNIQEEEEYLQRRKKLRSAILQQVRNWVKLGLTEN